MIGAVHALAAFAAITVTAATLAGRALMAFRLTFRPDQLAGRRRRRRCHRVAGSVQTRDDGWMGGVETVGMAACGGCGALAGTLFASLAAAAAPLTTFTAAFASFAAPICLAVGIAARVLSRGAIRACDWRAAAVRRRSHCSLIG